MTTREPKERTNLATPHLGFWEFEAEIFESLLDDLLIFAESRPGIFIEK